jgi:AP2-like factor (euAP2 lineage)
VTHHCRTGRWEAHIWEDGKQVYLGGFDSEQQAALAYDVAAIKCRGEEASTNFDMNDYAQELAALNSVGKEELVLSLRRQSKGFVKGSSKFRGVTRHQKGRWEARIGQLVGRKYRYLGLYDQEEEAAVAYDTEAVRQKGFDAVTNFDLSEYADVLAEHHALRRARRTLSHPIPEPDDPNAPASLPAASIKQRLKAASESSFGGMREGPAAEREPRGEAIDAVRAFFRDAGVEKALTPMDPIREMATNAGNAAAAVAAARERNARTTWAPMNDKGTLLDDEGDLEEEDVGGGGKTTIQALRAMVREARTQLASTQRQLEVAMIGTDDGMGTGDRDVDEGKN